MNKKDCTEYDSCMEARKAGKVRGIDIPMTHDSETNELVVDLECEGCHHYKTVGNH